RTFASNDRRTRACRPNRRRNRTRNRPRSPPSSPFLLSATPARRRQLRNLSSHLVLGEMLPDVMMS
ncbi:hypothetical protein PFISCL1PPCAC_14265, partial [Pristionchus fissidentatus]